MNNKKKLIVVGNKEDGIDRSKVVDSFDYVVRLNRCNNYGLTGTKTDLLLVDPHNVFFKLWNKEEYFKILDNTKNIIFEYCKYTNINQFNSLVQYLKDINLWDNAIIINKHLYYYYNSEFSYLTNIQADYSHGESHIAPSNFFIMLCYCLKYKSDLYDIYFTNNDLDRKFFSERHDNFPHERFLRKWLDEGKIFMLD